MRTGHRLVARWTGICVIAGFAAACGGLGPTATPTPTPTLVATPTPNVPTVTLTPALVATPTPTPTRPDLVVGTEALIAGVPMRDDGWRVRVDSVAHGSAVLAGGQSTLPNLPNGQEWLRLQFRVRYVGTGTPSQQLLAKDMSVFFQSAGINYTAKAVGASPALETDIAKDADVSVTFWFSIAESAPVIFLMWDAFGQPPDTYQWDLSPAVHSAAAAPEWTTPAAQKWKTLSGPVSSLGGGRDEVLLDPPGEFLIADWRMTQTGSVGCSLDIYFENDVFQTDSISETGPSVRGTMLLKLPGSTGDGSGVLNVSVLMASCPWRVDLAGIGSLFGPHSASVADFIWRTDHLGGRWAGIADRPATPNLVAAENRALTVAAANPDANAALGNALDPKWYRGNYYVDGVKNVGHLLAWSNAIIALVLRPSIDPSDFELLYEPFSAAIPSEILGSAAP
jgi:hypothetical protein